MPPVITLKMNTKIKDSVRISMQEAIISNIWTPMRHCLFTSVQIVAVQSAWNSSTRNCIEHFTIFIHLSAQDYFKQNK